MDMMWNETVFTFPFSFDGGLRKWKDYYAKNTLDQFWKVSRDIDSKFFLRYIYNDENRPIHYEYNPNHEDWNYENEQTVKTTLTGNGKPAVYTVKMVGLSLFVFPTGVGFITMRIRYQDDEKAGNIADFSAAFSRIFANERPGQEGKISCHINGKICSVVGLMKELVGAQEKAPICFFPCTNNRRTFVFHRLIQDSISEREKWALRRNLWVVDNSEDVDPVSDLEKVVRIDNNRYYMLSSTVMCVVTKKQENPDSEARRRQMNIRYSYFNLYLLCIHEQQGVLLYNELEVAIGKNIKNAKKIKKDLLRFLPSYSFRVVSTEIMYQQMFLDLQQILNLRELEDNLRDNISMLETAYEQERDQKLNLFLAILAVLGCISVLTDLLQLLTYF